MKVMFMDAYPHAGCLLVHGGRPAPSSRQLLAQRSRLVSAQTTYTAQCLHPGCN